MKNRTITRTLENDLVQWKDSPNRKPLILRGARQVGKTHLVEQFGKTYFSNLVVANFEFEKRLAICFETLDPKKIINGLSTMLDTHIKAGETLLFLDEIQECPQAILALRYFKEKMPELHVIAAGSLLEFTLKQADFRMPVGRTQSLYLKPLSFKEFLLNLNQPQLIEQLENASAQKGIDTVWHEIFLERLTEYLSIGGMPEVQAEFIHEKNLSQCQQIQASLLEDYPNDFGKYDTKVNARYLNKFYMNIPTFISQKFKYNKIDPETPSRDLKPALEALLDAGLLYQVKHSAAAGLPLTANVNERKFKLFFLDVGLLKHATKLDLELLMNNDITLLNKGSLAEQFVAQELFAYAPPYEQSHLFYWEREAAGSTAEVDFVINVGKDIYPVEVKSGKTGRLKSLQVFLNEKNCEFGIRLSQKPLSFENRVLSIPLYMISELPRLISGLT